MVLFRIIMKTMSLKLPAEVIAQLQARAQRAGRTKSALTREALARFLVEDGESGASCLDLVRDLVGVARGPADLASNKKRLRGYGR
jgi:predicted DNA-binding protein